MNSNYNKIQIFKNLSVTIDLMESGKKMAMVAALLVAILVLTVQVMAAEASSPRMIYVKLHARRSRELLVNSGPTCQLFLFIASCMRGWPVSLLIVAPPISAVFF